MKQLINELYQCAISDGLKNHIINDMGFNSEDKAIIKSLMEHNADSNFHYDNTGIGRGKFERKLNTINRIVIPEIIRLANAEFKHFDNTL